MPRDGAIIFSDLIGKLDVLRVSCDKCGRDGCYGLGRLIEKRGGDAKLIDWLDELTAECPKKSAHNMNEVSGVNILVQAMATTEFWIKTAFILVFSGGCLLATAHP